MRTGARGALSLSRLVAVAAGVACLMLLAVAGGTASAATGSAATERAKVDALMRDAIAHHGIKAAILQVTIDGKPLITKAYGESMTGVPATTAMHFRNGAVAISYMSTLLMELVDRHEVRLNDKVSKWLPWLRDANRVTLGELAGMSAGYHDFEVDPQLDIRLYSNPFAMWTTKEQLQLMLDKPLGFTPGTNFSYAHSDYVVLGLALSKITHEPLNVALRKWVLGPLGLQNTIASQTAAMPQPVLHGFTSERREFLKIKPGTPFYEDSTYWDPSWTLANGAVETTDIADMTRTAIGVGTGRLLTRRSYLEMINPRLGFGHKVNNKKCDRCQKLNRVYGYGLGVVRNGAWILQDPLFGGYAAIESYLPSQRISIALAETFDQSSFSPTGAYPKYWSTLYVKLGTLLAPHNAPVTHS